MKTNKSKTPFREYLEKRKIKVPQVAKELGITVNQLYYIWNGDCRPNHANAEKISKYTNGELTVEQLRPPMNREVCSCCGRLLKRHHILKLRSEERKKKKKNNEKKDEHTTQVEKKNPRKKSRGLLFP